MVSSNTPNDKQEWFQLLRDNIPAFNEQIKTWRKNHRDEVLDLSHPHNSLVLAKQLENCQVINLEGADLRGVNLTGHDFSTKIAFSKFVGHFDPNHYTQGAAIYDQHTVWPKGFDPKKSNFEFKRKRDTSPKLDAFTKDVLTILEKGGRHEEAALAIRELLPPMFQYKPREHQVS